MKRFGLLALLAMVLSLALAACGGSPAADSAGTGTAAQPTAAPTVTPEEMPEEEDPLLAAPVGNGGYDSCLTDWSWGKIVDVYESGGKYFGDVLVERATKEAGPRDAHACWQDPRGRWVFAQYDIEITKEAFDKLKGNRSDITLLAPAYMTVNGLSAEWVDSMWAHDYINLFTKEQLQALVNDNADALLAIGTLAATGLIMSAILPSMIGGPLAPECAVEQCG